MTHDADPARVRPERTPAIPAAAPPSGTWSALMVRAQGGDAIAYRTLLEEVGPWLRRWFARRLPPAMVPDAAQDTLMAIHEKRHTYDPARAFEPWLVSIARYKWIDRLRAMSRGRLEPLDEFVAVDSHEQAASSAITLERLLALLRPAQAEVIRLVKLQGFSIEEASRATGQSIPLVKVNIHRGLRRLAAHVRDDSPTGGSTDAG